MKGSGMRNAVPILSGLFFPPFPTFVFQQEACMRRLIMKKHNINAGMELLFILRQRRYLYHRLRILTGEQQLAGINSPISWPRKLIEGLRELNCKLRPRKANWQRIPRGAGSEYKAQIHKIVNQAQGFIGQILAVTRPQTAQDCRHTWIGSVMCFSPKSNFNSKEHV